MAPPDHPQLHIPSNNNNNNKVSSVSNQYTIENSYNSIRNHRSVFLKEEFRKAIIWISEQKFILLILLSAIVCCRFGQITQNIEDYLKFIDFANCIADENMRLLEYEKLLAQWCSFSLFFHTPGIC